MIAKLKTCVKLKWTIENSLETYLSPQQKWSQFADLLDLSSLNSQSILLKGNEKSNTVKIYPFRLNNPLPLTLYFAMS